MWQKLASLWKENVHRLARKLRLHKSKKTDYLAAYSEHTDRRVERDPDTASGRMAKMAGQLQFDFLVSTGLRRYHRLLDIGCGTLQAGRHFIKYLDAGNYSGMDISPKAIEYANRFVEMEGLSEKRPRLLVNKSQNLKFMEFDGEVFDFLLATSVFTHLKPEHIEECLQHVGRIMGPDSGFFFSFIEDSEFKQRHFKDFSYPYSYFQSLANKYGFRLRDRSDEFKKPVGQRMIMASK